MKGIVFNVFEEFVTENFGAIFYEEVVAAAKLQTKNAIFVGPGTYPDSDLLELLGIVLARKQLPLSPALELFGEYLFEKLAHAHPEFVAAHKGCKDFLMTVHNMIHVEVRKLYKDAITPHFNYEDTGDANYLVMIYQSPRRMPDLVAGLLKGAGKFFKTPIKFDMVPLAQNDSWRFEIRFN